MKLTVSIEYRTVWGEELVLRLGEENHPMKYVNDGVWKLDLDKVRAGRKIEYSYMVVRQGQTVRSEWGRHILHLPVKSVRSLVVTDSWQDRPEDAPFYSSAFTRGIFARGKSVAEKAAARTAGGPHPGAAGGRNTAGAGLKQ